MGTKKLVKWCGKVSVEEDGSKEDMVRRRIQAQDMGRREDVLSRLSRKRWMSSLVVLEESTQPVRVIYCARL